MLGARKIFHLVLISLLVFSIGSFAYSALSSTGELEVLPSNGADHRSDSEPDSLPVKINKILVDSTEKYTHSDMDPIEIEYGENSSSGSQVSVHFQSDIKFYQYVVEFWTKNPDEDNASNYRIQSASGKNNSGYEKNTSYKGVFQFNSKAEIIKGRFTSGQEKLNFSDVIEEMRKASEENTLFLRVEVCPASGGCESVNWKDSYLVPVVIKGSEGEEDRVEVESCYIAQCLALIDKKMTEQVFNKAYKKKN